MEMEEFCVWGSGDRMVIEEPGTGWARVLRLRRALTEAEVEAAERALDGAEWGRGLRRLRKVLGPLIIRWPFEDVDNVRA